MKKRFTPKLNLRRRTRRQPAPAPPNTIVGFDQFNLTVPDQFPRKGMVARAALAVVNSEAWTDANPNLNLSSFVTTFTEPEEMEVLKSHFTKNYIDHDMYPQLFAIEKKMVKWLHGLWNGPKNVEPYGAATIGSSEACMLAGLAHKWNWREARKKARKKADHPNMVTGGNVQIVWKKFLKYFDVEGRIAPLEVGNYRLTTKHLDQLVDENTICVVAIAGQTFTGEDDDIQEIHDWLDAYERRTGISIPMHIDGASGGFVNPFLYPDYKWDFRLRRVQSINASGHKFGLVPPGLGWVLFKERKFFNEDLIFYVNYLGGEMPTATLNFSRNAMQIAAQYYLFLRLGFEGYRDIMQHAVDNAVHLRERLVQSGYFKIMNETQRIPVVALTLNPRIKKYNEFDISCKVRERGWVLSAYAMPPNAENVFSLRIVVRPHLNRNVVNQLAEDVLNACKYLDKHGGTATPPSATRRRKLTRNVSPKIQTTIAMNTLKTISKQDKIIAVVAALSLLFTSSASASPKIKILATGGTIAGAQTSTAEAGYKSGSFSVDDLIKAVPAMTNLAELSGEQVANIGSQNMSHEVWLKLAKRVKEVLAGDTDGVVITHGTDTMEETAYFLSLVLDSDKPVILVGSMRPATAIGADGPANLYNAVALAADPASRGRGPLVILNDTIHYARETEKTHTTHLDTFKSPNRGLAGVMNTGKAFFYSKNTTRRGGFSLDGLTPENLPYVEIAYSYANFGGDTIDDMVKRGAKGIILAGVGDGNTTDAALAALGRAAKAGVVVVRSSRVGSGIVDRNVEVNDDKLGFITAMELNPQKARVLLMLGLTRTKDLKELQKLFTEY